jgi:hypothetical protein
VIELEHIVLSRERVQAVGAAAALLNISAVSYAAAHHTDGFIASDALADVLEPLRSLGVLDARHLTFDGYTAITDAADELVERLTAAELWLPADHGWILADATRPTRTELVDGWLRSEQSRLLDRVRQRVSRDKRRSRDSESSGHVTPHRSFGPPSGSNGSGHPPASVPGPRVLGLEEKETREIELAAPEPVHGSIAWYVAQLKGADKDTPAVVASALQKWSLGREWALARAMDEVKRARLEGVQTRTGREPLRNEVGFFMHQLERLGREVFEQ